MKASEQGSDKKVKQNSKSIHADELKTEDSINIYNDLSIDDNNDNQ